MLGDGSRLGFDVAHHVLVVHGEHLARQYLVPVIHQSHVLGVVMRQVIEVVREHLAVGKELLEGAEAAVQRMPPGVNDLRVGQDGV